MRDKQTEIPTPPESPQGLHLRYRIGKWDGSAVDPAAEYFVLRLDDAGKDKAHVAACRKAVLAYARHIRPALPILAADIEARWGTKPEFVTPTHAGWWWLQNLGGHQEVVELKPDEEGRLHFYGPSRFPVYADDCLWLGECLKP
jgi:hypothetical protein